MLDPQYNLQFDPEKVDRAVLSSHLFNSDFAIKRCLSELKAGSEAGAKLQFENAYQRSPIQCVRVASFALCNPAQYQLNKVARGLLFKFIVESLSTAFDDLSLVEQREIGAFIMTARFALLEGNFDEREWAKQLPESFEWLWVDSNHRPQHYECRALTS